MRYENDIMTAAEWLRNQFPNGVPRREVDDDAAETTLHLGQVASSMGRGHRYGLQPYKIHHPVHGTVNGWPSFLWRDAWQRLTRDHYLVYPETSAEPKRTLRFVDDERWSDLLQELVKSGTQDETPEQTLLRRQSISAAMYVIEKEYE